MIDTEIDWATGIRDVVSGVHSKFLARRLQTAQPAQTEAIFRSSASDRADEAMQRLKDTLDNWELENDDRY